MLSYYILILSDFYKYYFLVRANKCIQCDVIVYSNEISTAVLCIIFPFYHILLHIS